MGGGHRAAVGACKTCPNRCPERAEGRGGIVLGGGGGGRAGAGCLCVGGGGWVWVGGWWWWGGGGVGGGWGGGGSSGRLPAARQEDAAAATQRRHGGGAAHTQMHAGTQPCPAGQHRRRRIPPPQPHLPACLPACLSTWGRHAGPAPAAAAPPRLRGGKGGGRGWVGGSGRLGDVEAEGMWVGGIAPLWAPAKPVPTGVPSERRAAVQCRGGGGAGSSGCQPPGRKMRRRRHGGLCPPGRLPSHIAPAAPVATQAPGMETNRGPTSRLRFRAVALLASMTDYSAAATSTSICERSPPTLSADTAASTMERDTRWAL